MIIRPSSRLAKALDPRIVSLAAALPAVGADVNLHHQKCSLKPPRFRTEQKWHNDSPYLRVEPADGLVTVLISLDDTTSGKGATKFLRGSHRMTWLAADRTPSQGITDAAVAAKAADKEVVCPLNAGDVVLIGFGRVVTLHCRSSTFDQIYI